MKLLLVEDDQAIVLGLRYALEKEYEGNVCSTQKDALDAIARSTFRIGELQSRIKSVSRRYYQNTNIIDTIKNESN